MTYFFKQCIVVFLFSVLLSSSKCEQRRKLIIDNDAGGDDAMAIFLALLYEKHFNGPQVVALTTVNGNTVEPNVVKNNQRILKVAGRQDVPVYRGAKKSLVTTLVASGYYGADGLGDSGEVVTGLVEEHSMSAAAALIELSKKYEGNLAVVTLGPLTNIALAITLDPEFISRLDQLFIAAGHVYSEKFPSAEFNADMDAEAYRIVADNSNPGKVTLFPFSQTILSLNISKDWRNNVLGKIDSDIVRAQNTYERVSLEREGDWWFALDPAAVALVVNPDLIDDHHSVKNSIGLCGDNRGIMTTDYTENGEANIKMVSSVKKAEYIKMLLDVFSADVKTDKLTQNK